jgi:hypothetical protein
VCPPHSTGERQAAFTHFDDYERSFVRERASAAATRTSALQAEPGVARLVAVGNAFFDYLHRRTFPGGCFFAFTALEMGKGPAASRNT